MYSPLTLHVWKMLLSIILEIILKLYYKMYQQKQNQFKLINYILEEDEK